MPESQPISNTGFSNLETGFKPLLPLSVDNLVLRSGDKLLLDNLNLTLGKQGITVILGVNGAGKSLLLRVLHGLITPTAGEVLWGGNKLTNATRQRQAMVFQKPVLLRRSVAANIEFAITARRNAGRIANSQNFFRSSRNIDAVSISGLLQLARLDNQANQPARLLSGGEQQRLALARAIALSPEVLFLDEPTASLDPSSTSIIEDIVKEISQSGTKIMLVTHTVGQARRLAEDVVFLQSGRIQEHTPSEQFFIKPSSLAARHYLDGRLPN